MQCGVIVAHVSTMQEEKIQTKILQKRHTSQQQADLLVATHAGKCLRVKLLPLGEVIMRFDHGILRREHQGDHKEKSSERDYT